MNTKDFKNLLKESISNSQKHLVENDPHFLKPSVVKRFLKKLKKDFVRVDIGKVIKVLKKHLNKEQIRFEGNRVILKEYIDIQELESDFIQSGAVEPAEAKSFTAALASWLESDQVENWIGKKVEILRDRGEEPEEEPEEETQEEPESTWQDRYKDALAIAKRWYDKINNMPINDAEDLEKSINMLFSSKKQIVAERSIVPPDAKSLKIKNYQTVKDVFKSKDIQVAEPGPEGLGLPRFEAFVKVFADWDKNKIENGTDFQKVLLKYGPKFDPNAEKPPELPTPNAAGSDDRPDYMRSAAQSASSLRQRSRGAEPSSMWNSSINEEEDGYSERYFNAMLGNLSEKELAKVVIKYIKSLANNKLATSRGMSSGEELDDFSEKNIAGLINKLDDAKREIEDASTELTSNNLMTLVRYAMFGTFLEKPKSIRTIHGTFGNYIKTTLENFLDKEGNNIEKFMAGLLDNISKSPLWSSNAAAIVDKLYKGKEIDTLIALDQLIAEKPRGFQGSQNTKTIDDIISIYQQKDDALNEGIQGDEVKEYLSSFIPFAKNRLGYDKDPKINFVSDPKNGEIALGKTAYYEPATMSVTVFTDNRHPKDIMRSLSHELVHHAQNCDGQFDVNKGVGEGYAQNDKHLREMEEDAYLRGNMCFRDWEDGYKQTNQAFGNQLQERREKLYYELMRKLW